MSCPCAGGQVGTQTCKEDGSGWGDCGPCTPGFEAADGAGSSDSGSSTTDDAATDAQPEVWSHDAALDVGPSLDPADAVVADAGYSESCSPCGTGSVKGIICAPSEQVYVGNAHVTVSVIGCDGLPATLETWSGPDGSYWFPEVPCGLHKVYVSAGSFTNQYTIDVKTGKTTDLSGVGKKQCFKANAVPIAVFWGQWDHQHDLLDQLGFDFTYYEFEWEYFNDVDPDDIEAVQVLRDPALLAQYKVLFFNCGSAPLKYVHSYPEIADNLREFVLGGGSLYASDLAWAYLEAAFPDAFDFYGSVDLPKTPMANDGPQQAASNVSIPCTILDPKLSEYVGVGTFTAKYGPGPLIAVEAPGPGSAVHVSAAVKFEDPAPFKDYFTLIQPVVLSHQPQPGAGRLVYTTFHNDEQADAVMLKILYYLVFTL